MRTSMLKGTLRDESKRKFVKVTVRNTFIALILLALVITSTVLCIGYALLPHNPTKFVAGTEPAPSPPYRPCLVQLFGDADLHNGTSVTAAGARLSVEFSRRFAKRHGIDFHLYDCGGLGTCTKAPSIGDACYNQGCTHVLYLDADVLLHDERVDIVGHFAKTYPHATMISGIDYYTSMRTPQWHNGEWRLYRTDTNTGMLQFNCHRPLSRRVLAEWERLCRRFSPYRSDQEAMTLMETFPQYERLGVFVRDAFLFGQYSVLARHFPGGSGKHEEYPLITMPDYKKRLEDLRRSGTFKWVHLYWTQARGMDIPETEKWRLENSTEKSWKWNGPAFKKCPYDSEESYVDGLINKMEGTKSNRSANLDYIPVDVEEHVQH